MVVEIKEPVNYKKETQKDIKSKVKKRRSLILQYKGQRQETTNRNFNMAYVI